jgi:hypothetical protein
MRCSLTPTVEKDLTEIVKKARRGKVFDLMTGTIIHFDTVPYGLAASITELENLVDETFFKYLLALKLKNATEKTKRLGQGRSVNLTRRTEDPFQHYP